MTTHTAVGRSQTVACAIDPARASALHQVLGGSDKPPEAGDPLPNFWHQIYFWNPLPAERLGRDGHTERGGFIPDLGLPRRMWAGGEIEFHSPVIIGEAAEKRSTITEVTTKTGRSGPLGFCTIRHEIFQAGALKITDQQNLVFREDVDPGAQVIPPPQAPDKAEYQLSRSFDPVMLFRYSALTLNGHRIHYDQTYARDVEFYPDLVVHGPLLAQHLMKLADAHADAYRCFSYRATAPLFVGERADFMMQGKSLWVRGPDGRQCMSATIS